MISEIVAPRCGLTKKPERSAICVYNDVLAVNIQNAK
jgi:hypothetical protein